MLETAMTSSSIGYRSVLKDWLFVYGADAEIMYLLLTGFR